VLKVDDAENDNGELQSWLSKKGGLEIFKARVGV